MLSAQVSAYSFQQSAGAYSALTGGTVVTGLGDDGSSNGLPIGFTFNFGGVNYTTFNLNANGFINFGVNITTSSFSNLLSNTTTYRPLLAPFWDDNNATGGTVSYLVTGTAPNRVLTVDWNNINIGGSGSTSTTNKASYNLKIYETTNVIEFNYASIMATAGTLTASVGINDNVSYLSVTPAAGNATVSSTTANNSISTTANLVSNRYTFSPPAPCSGQPPVLVASATVTSTATCNSTSTLSVTGAPPASGFSYQWRKNGVNISGATAPTYLLNIIETASYDCVFTCTTSGLSSTSNSVLITLTTPCPTCPTNLGPNTVVINSLPYNGVGLTNCGNGNNITSTNAAPTCGSISYYGGEDRTFIFTATRTGTHTITLTTTSTWSGLMLYNGCPFAGQGSICIGNSQSSSGSKTLTVNLVAGVTYYLIVDSFPSPNCHPSFNLSITQPAITLYFDGDSDTFGDPNNSIVTAENPPGYVGNNLDCDDTNSAINPNATEICDGLDNNCNGMTDEGVTLVFYEDKDNDGFGDPNGTTSIGCIAPTGFVSNNLDFCPLDPNKIAAGICGCGISDADSDNDGTADCNDECPNDPNKTAAGTCGCGVADIDSDGDLTLDCNDECPNDPNKTAPGTCGCGIADIDSDGDMTLDCNDACPNDPNKTAPGACGCGVADTDSDGDLVADCIDGCPNDPNKSVPGACGCGVTDTDSDGDLVADCNDGCPNDPNKIAPGTCGCGISDVDSDGDLVANCNDGCPNDPNKIAPGTCGCGISDVDSDGDLVADCNDGCPNDPNKIAPGTCGCGVSDVDSDGDLVADCNDGCPNDPNKIASGTCGCGVSDVDSDGDLVADCNDGCPNDPNLTAPAIWYQDNDGDGFGNSNVTLSNCVQPEGYVAVGGDCNDNNSAINPNAAEECNGVDDNCNGQADEGCTFPQMVVRGNNVIVQNGDSTPSTLDFTDFATINFNTTRTRTFVISNTGLDPLLFNGSQPVTITGEGAQYFTVVAQPSGSVLPGGQKSFQITFTASAAGTHIATVSIATNDTENSPYSFDIRGNVNPGQIRVTGNNITIQDEDVTPASNDLTLFASRTVGTNIQNSLYVRNTGTGLLVLSGTPRVTITGPGAAHFTVTSQPVATLSPNGSSLLRIRFAPLSAGYHEATVHILSNDPNVPEHNFTIAGTGIGTALVANEGNPAVLTTSEIGTDQTIDSEIRAVENKTLELTVYPNPTVDRLMIRLSGFNTTFVGQHIVNILSMDGKVVLSRNFDEYSSEINVSSLDQGIYLIEVRKDGLRTIQRFVKL